MTSSERLVKRAMGTLVESILEAGGRLVVPDSYWVDAPYLIRVESRDEETVFTVVDDTLRPAGAVDIEVR